MDEVMAVFCFLAIWFGGYVLGKPNQDEIFVGSESGYTCTEVQPATEVGEEAKCAIYRLETGESQQ